MLELSRHSPCSKIGSVLYIHSYNFFVCVRKGMYPQNHVIYVQLAAVGNIVCSYIDHILLGIDFVFPQNRHADLGRKILNSNYGLNRTG